MKDKTNIIIFIDNLSYIKYDDIIAILDVEQITKISFYNNKTILNNYESMDDIKSFIYCKNNFLVASKKTKKNILKQIEKQINI